MHTVLDVYAPGIRKRPLYYKNSCITSKPNSVHVQDKRVIGGFGEICAGEARHRPI